MSKVVHDLLQIGMSWKLVFGDKSFEFGPPRERGYRRCIESTRFQELQKLSGRKVRTVVSTRASNFK